ncbi:hypothetical protein ACFWU3_15130 [Streptomyces sp. NPDC058685]|uniref:hypothetical protein n=1 Tax=Streptomyces sp. NPDC058685 TaxID=3346598 RepID=UPI00364FADC9
MAAAALALSIITFLDTRTSSEDNDQKEASKISWYFLESDGIVDSLTVENRGLLPAYDTFLNIEDEKNVNMQRFEIGELGPCSRTVFKFGDKGKLVRGDQYVELFFRDSKGYAWRMGYAGVLSNLGKVRIARGSELDYVGEWKLGAESIDLDACG